MTPLGQQCLQSVVWDQPPQAPGPVTWVLLASAGWQQAATLPAGLCLSRLTVAESHLIVRLLPWDRSEIASRGRHVQAYQGH